MMIITFTAGGEQYAVELEAVASVARRGSGDEVPVLDLAERVGGAPAGDGAPEVRLVRGGRDARLRVERLGEVREVDPAAMREVPRLFASPLLRGIVPVDDRLLIMLAADALVAEAHAAAEGAR